MTFGEKSYYKVLTNVSQCFLWINIGPNQHSLELYCEKTTLYVKCKSKLTSFSSFPMTKKQKKAQQRTFSVFGFTAMSPSAIAFIFFFLLTVFIGNLIGICILLARIPCGVNATDQQSSRANSPIKNETDREANESDVNLKTR